MSVHLTGTINVTGTFTGRFTGRGPNDPSIRFEPFNDPVYEIRAEIAALDLLVKELPLLERRVRYWRTCAKGRRGKRKRAAKARAAAAKRRCDEIRAYTAVLGRRGYRLYGTRGRYGPFAPLPARPY